MSIDKFRLDWRNSPQKQFDAMVQMVVYLKGMLDKLTDIDVKLNALTAISNLVSTQTQAILQLGDRVENMQTVLNTIADLERSQSLLLQAVSDNTSCTCNTLQSVVQKQSEQNNKIDVIIDLLQGKEPPVPLPVYSFEVRESSLVLEDSYIQRGYFDVSAISQKDGIDFDSVSVVDCPDWLDPVVFVLSDFKFRFKILSAPPLLNLFTIKISQSESNMLQSFALSYTDYTVIAGVKWAKTNLISAVYPVSSNDSIFSAFPDSHSSLYQWSRKKAWSGTDIVGFNKNGESGIVWLNEASPCPEGWRLPTEAEFQSLVDSGSTWRAKNTVGNSYGGLFFGANHAEASFDDFKGCLFLPAAGYRDDYNGSFVYSNELGRYVTSVNSGTRFWGLGFNSSSCLLSTFSKSGGYSIRLVKGAVQTHALAYEFNGGYPSSGTAPGNYQQGETIHLPSMDKVGFTLNGFLSSAWMGYKQPGDTFVMPPIDTLVIADWSEILADSIDVTNTSPDELHVIILPKGQQPNWSDDIRYYLSGGDTLPIAESSDGEHMQEGISYTLFYNQDGVLGQFDFIFHGGDSYNIPV